MIKRKVGRIWYKLRKWIHDEFGLHRIYCHDFVWENEKKQKITIPYRWCSFCGQVMQWNTKTLNEKGM